MSDYAAIADVSDTLKKLLWENMKTDPKIYPDIIGSENDITLSSPEGMGEGNTKKLSLFLYQINEFPYMRNQEMQRIGSVKLKHVPLELVLFYLVTPNTEDIKKDHILIGKVMQTFNNNTVARGSILQGGLAGTKEEIRIAIYPLPFENLFNLWQSFSEKSFKLSVCYQVTPVEIESTREMDAKRVVEKEAGYYQMSIKKEA